MPQNPNPINTAINPNDAYAPMNLDASGLLRVVAEDTTVAVTEAASAAYNKSASVTIKASAGKVGTVTVLVAGSAPGAIHDCAATGDAAAGNKIAGIPNTLGVYPINWPCATGITYIVGTGQTVAVSYT